jgi:hypothetical protein
MATTASLLSQIEAAIEALLTSGAASYSIGARTVTKLDLAELFNERRLLQHQLSLETRGSIFSLAKIGRKS